MNNLLSYYGLVVATISASEKDLPVKARKSLIAHSTFIDEFNFFEVMPSTWNGSDLISLRTFWGTIISLSLVRVDCWFWTSSVQAIFNEIDVLISLIKPTCDNLVYTFCTGYLIILRKSLLFTIYQRNSTWQYILQLSRIICQTFQ